VVIQLRDLYKEILELQRFVDLNKEAARKIVKKLDKCL
jgi:uncharacterized protein (DUF1778 family)